VVARRLFLFFAAVLALVALTAPAAALGLPIPTPSLPIPLPTVSLPPLLPTPSPPLPSPPLDVSPPASPGPTATPVPTGGGAGGFGAGGGGGFAAVDPTPIANPASTPTPTPEQVIETPIGPLPSQVPLFPVLLPVFAGLLLLLVSAVLAAYRRTQEARRLEALERAKSDFMKLASHELRTPLTVLRGYVSMIRDGDIKPETPAFKRALPIIEDRLNQVNTIVEQMLEAARLEEDSARLESDRFDLGDVMQEAVDSIRPRAGETHPIAIKRPLRELPLWADRNRVAGIIEQLLDNAIKYSPQGGEIAVTLTDRDGQALLTVRDHGLGIASSDLQRVFSRFGRLVTRDNSHIPGAGLGLYLARRHARLMGGDIAVDSWPQKGSAFTLRLPLVNPPGVATGPAEGVPVPSS
jgi:signal transduction histidine kinase